MNEVETQRIERLTRGPVLRTRAGCRARVAALSLGQRWDLAYHLQCDVEDLDWELHDRNHKKRRPRGAAGTSKEGETT